MTVMQTITNLDSAAHRPIVIVGAGIAGISAALAAADAIDTAASRGDASRADQKVVLIGSVDGSNTYHAQGGIAAAVFSDDDPALHTRDTLVAGAGLCDPVAVDILTREGKDRVNELIAEGVHFDRDANGDLVRGLEGAHSRKRILHAGGDATGRVVETDIAAMVRGNERIVPLDVYVYRLARDGESLRVMFHGLPGDDASAGTADASIEAERVILATGGAGIMYPHTTNPAGANANGVAMALMAGAQVADLEFYQFHPTALAMGDNFLISEAVRGEGAQLFNETGERYMPGIDARAELAPRDIVARENFKQMMAQDGRPVFLDTRPIGARHPDMPLAEFLARRFPTIDAYLKAKGIDWSRERVPITPAAHYYMGGVRTDMHGRTSVPGLYAAGECARTGVQGANRLASNSLLEGLVFGHRAGIAAVTDPAGTRWDPRPLNVAEGATTDGDDAHPLAPTYREALDSATGERQVTGTDCDAETGGNDSEIAERIAGLEHTMWFNVGVLRDAPHMESALPTLAQDIEWFGHTAAAAQKRYGEAWQAARDGGEDARDDAYRALVAAHNGRCLAITAFAATVAALARTESRGAHARTDYPDTDPAQAVSRAFVWDR